MPNRMPRLASYAKYVHFLNTYHDAGSASSEQSRSRIKSYIFETAPAPCTTTANAAMVFAEANGFQVDSLESTDSCVVVDSEGPVALFEYLDGRFPVMHSTLDARHMDSMVAKAVRSSPWLDQIWLTSEFYYSLWQWMETSLPEHRTASMHLTHEAESAPALLASPNTEEGFVEFNISRKTLHARIRTLVDELRQMSEQNKTAWAIRRLNIPSGNEGSHEVYHNGKLTNWSSSHTEQMKLINFIIDKYSQITERIQEELWFGTERSGHYPQGYVLKGKPAVIQFRRPMSPEKFQQWAAGAFKRHSRYRLAGQIRWGDPEERTQLQVYGMDRHTWSPIALEASLSHFLLVLPAGACPNIVNRLASQVESSHLTPSVQTWVGDTSYAELLA